MDNDFYKSARWRKLRAAILRRDQYMDQVELRRGRQVAAEVVHHIFPREQYPEYQYMVWNLISVSRDTHEQLHNRVYGGLSAAGQRLLEETATRQGIPISRLVLVVGLPGSGKTSYVRQHIGGGLAYDLDYLAAAFRLIAPQSERHGPARRMANALADGFALNSRRYAANVFVIRTAPPVEEAERYDPDALVICIGGPGRQDVAADDWDDMQRRVDALREWAQANSLPVMEVHTPPGVGL